MLKITNNYKQCEHEKAFYYNQEKDEHEGRIYDLIYCPDCGCLWEEQSYMNNHRYPKGNLGK